MKPMGLNKKYSNLTDFRMVIIIGLAVLWLIAAVTIILG